jgi:hypothetical protein
MKAEEGFLLNPFDLSGNDPKNKDELIAGIR